MQMSIIVLVACTMLLAYVQGANDTSTSEYEIKQGLLSGGRSYDIKSQINAPSTFSIKNELFSIGKKLILLENGKELYVVKHSILELMSTWTITEASSGKELGVIKNKVKLIGSKIVATGAFGRYTIEGKFRNHSFSIKKDGQRVAKIEKKSFHLHDTYGVTVYGNADKGLMILFSIIVDEIRQHWTKQD